MNSTAGVCITEYTERAEKERARPAGSGHSQPGLRTDRSAGFGANAPKLTNALDRQAWFDIARPNPSPPADLGNNALTPWGILGLTNPDLLHSDTGAGAWEGNEARSSPGGTAMHVTTHDSDVSAPESTAERALARIGESARLIDEEIGDDLPASRSPLDVQVLSLSDGRVAELLNGSGPLWDQWRERWAALHESERDAAAHPAWITAWLRAYVLPQRRDVRLFVCRCEQQLLAVLPFEVLPSIAPWCRTCELRMPADIPLEGASLALPASELPRVFDALFGLRLEGAGRPSILTFDKVDETHAVLRQEGLHCLREEVTPRSVIECGQGYDRLLEELGGNFRGNLRKSRNKLEKLIVVRFDELTSAAEVADGIARFVDVERRSWKAREGTDLANDPSMQEFFSFALTRLAESGQAVVHLLQAGGSDLAALLALRFGDRLDVHKISFDDRYADMSPGNLLLERVMRDAAPRLGITRVNLVTHLPWHARWKPSLVRTYRVRIFAPGPRGLWARARTTPFRSLVRSGLARLGWLEPLRYVRYRIFNRPG